MAKTEIENETKMGKMYHIFSRLFPRVIQVYENIAKFATLYFPYRNILLNLVINFNFKLLLEIYPCSNLKNNF
jgi:hypothetical protein